MAAPLQPSPDRVPLSSIKPLCSDEGMSWDELIAIVGPADTAPRTKHTTKDIRARGANILGAWTEAAEVEKAKGKERKPKKQQPLIKPAVTAAKGPLPEAHVFEKRQPTPQASQYQPTLGLL